MAQTETKLGHLKPLLEFLHLIFAFIEFLCWCADFTSLTVTGVKAVFSGHYHRNAGGCHGGLDMVVSSAIGCQLGEDTHGVRVVVVTADDVIHRYHSLEQLRAGGMDEDLRKLLQAWVPEQGNIREKLGLSTVTSCVWFVINCFDFMSFYSFEPLLFNKVFGEWHIDRHHHNFLIYNILKSSILSCTSTPTTHYKMNRVFWYFYFPSLLNVFIGPPIDGVDVIISTTVAIKAAHKDLWMCSKTCNSFVEKHNCTA